MSERTIPFGKHKGLVCIAIIRWVLSILLAYAVYQETGIFTFVFVILSLASAEIQLLLYQKLLRKIL